MQTNNNLSFLEIGTEKIPHLGIVDPMQADVPDNGISKSSSGDMPQVDEGCITARNPWISDTFFVETFYFDIIPHQLCFEARSDTANALKVYRYGKAGITYLVEFDVECLQVNRFTGTARMGYNDRLSHDFTLGERALLQSAEQASVDGMYCSKLTEALTTGGDLRARWKVHQIRVVRL